MVIRNENPIFSVEFLDHLQARSGFPQVWLAHDKNRPVAVFRYGLLEFPVERGREKLDFRILFQKPLLYQGKFAYLLVEYGKIQNGPIYLAAAVHIDRAIGGVYDQVRSGFDGDEIFAFFFGNIAHNQTF